MQEKDQEQINRILAIIDRNMTPEGPNQDAKALLWALQMIRDLSKKVVDMDKEAIKPFGGPVIATSWGEDGF